MMVDVQEGHLILLLPQYKEHLEGRIMKQFIIALSPKANQMYANVWDSRFRVLTLCIL